MTSNADLRCEDLTVGYRRDLPSVIDRLTLGLPTGAITTITGASGSGKSTLLYTLALLLTPQNGGVFWKDESLADLPDGQRAQWRAQQTGFIFQDALLDPARSILDNVCEPAVFNGMARHIAVQRARELLEQFDLAHRLSHRPDQVSGGQAQRVGLCRALINFPRIIFGDEPTGNLDTATADVVWTALRGQAETGVTVIIATHDLRLAELSDNRIEL